MSAHGALGHTQVSLWLTPQGLTVKPPKYWGSPRATRASSASDTPTKPIFCHPNFTKGGLRPWKGWGAYRNPRLDPHLPAQGSVLAAAQEVPSRTPAGPLSLGEVGWWVGSAQASVCLKFQHLQNIHPGLFWGGISYRNVNIRDLEGSCQAWRWWPGSPSSSRGGGWFWESVPGLPSGWELRFTPPWEPGLLWPLCSIRGLLCDLRSEARPLWARRANGTDSVFSPHLWP